jgi:hypothetical protein
MKKIGTAVEKARPYYEARIKAKEVLDLLSLFQYALPNFK